LNPSLALAAPGALKTRRRESKNCPGRKCAPRRNIWPISQRFFENLRDVVGWDMHLLHDAHHRLTPIEAARLGKDLEPYRLFWLEDPVPAELPEGYRTIRAHTTTPIALGEIFNTIWNARVVMEEQLIDYIGTTWVHAGGVPACAEFLILPQFTMCAPPATGRPMFRRWPWGPTCMLIYGCPTSVFRNTPVTTRPPMRRSRAGGNI